MNIKVTNKIKKAFLVVIAPTCLLSQDLLVNGNLETWTNVSPDNWTVEDVEVTQEMTIINEGTTSAKLVPQPDGPQLPTASISQEFVLNTTDEYTLSFDYFVPGVTVIDNSVDRITYSLQQLTAGNAFFFTTGESISDASLVREAWTTVTYTVKVLSFNNGATDTTIKLNLRANAFMQSGTDAAYIDNISLVPSNILTLNNFNTSAVKISPNPTTDKIKFSGYKNISHIALYDIKGTLITTSDTIENNELDINQLPKGTYFLTCSSEIGNTSHKIIKQ